MARAMAHPMAYPNGPPKIFGKKIGTRPALPFHASFMLSPCEKRLDLLQSYPKQCDLQNCYYSLYLSHQVEETDFKLGGIKPNK